MSKTMKAAVVRAFGQPLQIEEVTVPAPGAGQVLVKIEACGVCHTDLHAAHGDWPVKPNPPFIPGHEGVGYMAEVGAGVHHVKEGDRVGIPWLYSACGHCEHCLGGWETLCESQQNTPDTQGNPVKDAKGNPVMVDNKADKQTIAMGPTASQEAIKMLGTNGGGGFFNANSAHPYENPTPFANFVQMIAMLVIGAALCLVFGRMVGDQRQGYAILAAMTIAFAAACWVEISAEQGGNPLFASLHVDQTTSALQPGGNMEGKETRFGIVQSGIFTVATTSASCGAVNNMHDSLTPIGELVPLLLIELGEVIFGGVGSGLYGILVFALLAVFVAGLMIGRTPEYVGKKIESYEMKMVSIAVLLTRLLVLVGASVGVLSAAGTVGIANPGPHGFSEILYAYSSAGNNNGSAFAGLSVNTSFYNVTLAIAMWFGRFGSIVPVLAIAGSLAGKKRIAVTAGTLPTHGPLFVVLLLGTVILVGALTYVPALALGPVVEHLMMISGH